MHRFKRFGRWLLIGLLLIGFVYWLDSAIYGLPSRLPGEAYPPRFTLSKETTYFTGPVDKNGYIDYAKALNEKLSVGIDPQENVIVALLPAFGPKPCGKPLTPEFFEWLDASPPPDVEAMVSFEEFLGSDKSLDPSRRKQLIDVARDRAQKTPWGHHILPEVFAWLQASENALAYAVKASHKTEFFYPLVPLDGAPPGNGPVERAALAAILIYRELCAGLLCRAQLQIANGQFEEAKADILCAHRLARLLAKGPLKLQFLLGRALERNALEAGEVLLKLAEFPQKSLEGWANDLDALPGKTSLTNFVNLGQRSFYLESTMLMNQIGPSEFYLHKLNQEEVDVKKLSKISNITLDYDDALVSINNAVDFILDCFGENSFLKSIDLLNSAYDSALQKVNNNNSNYVYEILWLNLYKRRLLPNKHAENIRLLMLGVTRRSAVADARVSEREDLFRLALALAIHRKAKGSFPEKLEELVPAFLKEIPGDRFSNRGLIYDKGDDGYILYSVGPNGKDEQGRGPDDVPPGDDLRMIKAPPAMDQGK